MSTTGSNALTVLTRGKMSQCPEKEPDDRAR